MKRLLILAASFGDGQYSAARNLSDAIESLSNTWDFVEHFHHSRLTLGRSLPTHSFMKVLLRDEKARLYYATNDDWVADPNAAMDFKLIENGRLSLTAWRYLTLLTVKTKNRIERQFAFRAVKPEHNGKRLRWPLRRLFAGIRNHPEPP